MSGSDIVKITEEIVQVRIPLPFSLKWVNSYLIREETGYTLIDPGLNVALCRDAWNGAMRELHLSFADISRIVLTHYHPDHYGLAGWFQQKTAAPVLISEKGYRGAQSLWGENRLPDGELRDLFSLHGMPSEISGQMVPHVIDLHEKVEPHPEEVRFLLPGALIKLGSHEYQMIETPGHADGHLVFYQPETKEMFCGDQVLHRISPNISYVPGHDPNPLQSYLISLGELRSLDVQVAYPGHREVIRDFRKRVDELAAHHHIRLAEMLGMVGRRATAYEICDRTFGDRLDIHQLRFAMAETLAHLIYLEKEGKIVRRKSEGTVYFTEGG